MGMRKPDAECFLKVIHDHHLNAHENSFIDDTIQHVKVQEKWALMQFFLKKEVTIIQLLLGIIQLEPRS